MQKRTPQAYVKGFAPAEALAAFMYGGDIAIESETV
jgi:hypothetical protein